MILKYIFYTNVIVVKMNVSVYSILRNSCFLWNFTMLKLKTNFQCIYLLYIISTEGYLFVFLQSYIIKYEFLCLPITIWLTSYEYMGYNRHIIGVLCMLCTLTCLKYNYDKVINFNKYEYYNILQNYPRMSQLSITLFQ